MKRVSRGVPDRVTDTRAVIATGCRLEKNRRQVINNAGVFVSSFLLIKQKKPEIGHAFYE